MPTSMDDAFAAANRSQDCMWRLLDMLGQEPAEIDYRHAHDILVESVLAHVRFLDLAKRLMRRTVPPGDRMYGAIQGYPLLNKLPSARAHDYAWAQDS